MRIPDEKLQEITDRIDIVEIIGNYVTLKPAGRSYLGLCPFHHEKTPSFNVNREKKFYHCFGCGKGGSVFKFLMEMEGLDFPEAAERLAKKAGVVLERTAGNEPDNQTKKLYDTHQRVTGSFQHLLLNTEPGKKALDYLTGRGVTREMIELFQIGWAPDDRFWLFRFLKSKNYSPEFLSRTGYFTSKNPQASLFWDRVMFPIKNASGSCIGFGGRALREGAPKYINSPESPVFQKRRNLYALSDALPEIRKQKEFILVEGYLDVIAFFQAGIPRAVAPLGTAFTEEQARVLHRYAENGVLVFDGDEAGFKAAWRAVHICEQEGIKARVVQLPPGIDPADLLQKEGPGALHKLLKSSINNFDYLIARAVSDKSPDTPEGKEAILRELAEFLTGIESQVRREGMIRKLSDVLEVDYRSIEADLRRLARKTSPAVPADEKKQEGKISKELYLMLAVAANRGQFSYVREQIRYEDLLDPRAKSLYIVLEEEYRADNRNDAVFLDRIDDVELQTLLTGKMTSGEFSLNPERIIRQSMLEVKRESILRARSRVERQLEKIRSGGGDYLEEQKLLADKMFLDKESEKLRVTGNDGNTG